MCKNTGYCFGLGSTKAEPETEIQMCSEKKGIREAEWGRRRNKLSKEVVLVKAEPQLNPMEMSEV